MPTEHQARTLTDWLMAEGIDAKFEQETNGFEVWVKQEDLLDRAKIEFAQFQTDPLAARYAAAATRAAEIRKSKVEKQRQFERNLRAPRAGWSSSRSTLTLTLIVISGFIAVLTNFGRQPVNESPALKALAVTYVAPPDANQLWEQAGGDPGSLQLKFASLIRGEVWRLVTPIFLHFSPLHLVFNLIWLYQLGRLIESRYGAGALALLVITIGVCSNVGQVLVPENLGGTQVNFFQNQLLVQLGGMSGVIYGLFGFVWVKATIDPASRMQMGMSTIVVMIAWLFFCMSPAGEQIGGTGGSSFRVANWAHAIGLVCGMASAYLTTIWKSNARR